MNIFATLNEVADKLEEAGIEYMIGGSLASSVWGEERATRDVDVAAIFSASQIDKLQELFDWPYIIDADSMRESLRTRAEFASGQILNGETQDKLDLFILRNDEYANCQLRRKRFVELFPGKEFPIASPEDIVITKLRSFVLGNRVSDKQWNDIVQVLEIQDGQLDEAYMTKWANHFDVLDLLRDAKSQVIQL